jgi:uncharacterized membrane protein YkoI
VLHLTAKTQQATGSLKAIELIMRSLASLTIQIYMAANGNGTSSGGNETTDEYNLFKIKTSVKAFLVDLLEYMRTQLAEMGRFLDAHGRKTPRSHNNNNSTNSKKFKLDTEASTSGGGAAASIIIDDDDDDDDDDNDKRPEPSQFCLAILRQIAAKRKPLEDLIDMLVELIDEITAGLALANFSVDSESDESDSDDDDDDDEEEEEDEDEEEDEEESSLRVTSTSGSQSSSSSSSGLSSTSSPHEAVMTSARRQVKKKGF